MQESNSSLSTFNFKIASFLRSLLLFILPILAGLGVMEVLLRRAPNAYTFKKLRYLERGAEFEVLILGNSHFLHGVNPRDFRLRAFNGAHPSQTWDIDYALLQAYRRYLPRLKWVVLPASYFSPFQTLANGPEPFRVKNYVIYYGLDLAKRPSDHFEVLNHPRINVERLLNLRTDSQEAVLTEDGFGTKPPKSIDFNKNAKIAVQRHTATDPSSPPSIPRDSLAGILKFCKAENIHVLIVTPPVSSHYRALLNPIQLEAGHRIVSNAVSGYQNVRYVDLSKDVRFLDTDFSDSDHLNSDGAHKLSVHLDSELAQP